MFFQMNFDFSYMIDKSCAYGNVCDELMRLIPNAGCELMQGWHRLEKYFNIQDCLEKTLKIKFKTLKGLEKPLNFTICKKV